MESGPCPGCDAPVQFTAEYSLGNKTWVPYCDNCRAQQEAEHQNRLREIAIAQGWNKICPERFRETEFAKLPHPDKSQVALDWDFKDGHGLNLWGVPNSGKTRTMFLVVRKLFDAGRAITVFSTLDFCNQMAARGFQRATWVHNLGNRDVICFDDIDKLTLTGPQEKLFFALLDKRMHRKAPCIFTHNSTAHDLTYKFKTGEALVRRIRQFTRAIHFP
jgi:DNA replication protein DnaC